MSKLSLVVVAACAVAVCAEPADVTIYTLNPDGGVTASGGLKLSVGWNNFVLFAGGESLFATGPNHDAKASLADSSWTGQAMMLYVGGPVNGASFVSEYLVLTDMTGDLQSWTSAESTGADAESGSISQLLTGTIEARDYTIRSTYTYTFPNNYIQIDWEFTIPEGHDATYDVIAYFFGDTTDGAFTPTNTFADAATASFGLVVDGSGAGYSTEMQIGFQYVCGDVDVHYSVGEHFEASGLTDDGQPGFYTHEDYTDRKGPADDDTNIQLSFNLGKLPGTYKARMALIAGDGGLPNLTCDAAPPARPYAQVVALWIGFSLFLMASLYLLIRSAFLASSAFAALPIFLLLSTAITALAYLIMVLSETSFALYCNGRQFEWMRYAAWGAVAPLTVVALGNLAGARFTSVVFAASTAFVAVAGLFAGAVSPNCIAAWPLLAFSIVAGLVVAKELLFDFSQAAARFAGGRFASLYSLAAYYQLALWVGYAIVWGVSEGGKVTTATQEIITFTVLDILSKAVFAVFISMGRTAVVKYGSISAWLGGEELSISIYAAAEKAL